MPTDADTVPTHCHRDVSRLGSAAGFNTSNQEQHRINIVALQVKPTGSWRAAAAGSAEAEKGEIRPTNQMRTGHGEGGGGSYEQVRSLAFLHVHDACCGGRYVRVLDVPYETDLVYC
jgi:hypothetical protein